ncbi:MAG: GFA family protein [Planktomarina sp.]
MLDLSPSPDAIRRTGQCACGAVSVSAIVTKTYGVCHCTTCRRWSGGVWMGVLAGKTAEVSGDVQVWKSSAWADRGHCPKCGTAIWHRFRATGDTTLGQGLFDDQSDWQMTREIFSNEKPDHYEFGSGAVAYTGWGFLCALLTGKLAK